MKTIKEIKTEIEQEIGESVKFKSSNSIKAVYKTKDGKNIEVNRANGSKTIKEAV